VLEVVEEEEEDDDEEEKGGREGVGIKFGSV